MRDSVTLLGSKGGAALRPGSSMPSSSLLTLGGRRIVVDCGLGVARGLVNAGIELPSIELIFVTHLHSDHYLELGPLLHVAWTSGLKRPVDVYGPRGLQAYWSAFLDAMRADIALRVGRQGRPDLAGLVRIHATTPGRVLERDGLTVDALRTDHPPLTDAFAYGFRSGGRHVVFSGDTASHPPLAAFAQGADLLVHEAMLEDALPALIGRVGGDQEKLLRHITEGHSKAADAAAIATEAGVRQLVLNHLIPSDDPSVTAADWEAAVRPHWSGSLSVGRDGLTILLPEDGGTG